MSTLKECQIIKLNTFHAVEERLHPNLRTTNGSLFTDGKVIGEYIDHDRFLIQQHLYGYIYELPKAGEWYIDDANQIRQSITDDKDYWDRRKDYKKIIATTALLPLNDNTTPWTLEHKYLPSFSTGFIQKYCNVGDIDKVMVEYDIDIGYTYDTNFYKTKLRALKRSQGYPEVPIVRKDNTIITKPIKTSWTREEVELLCRKAYEAGQNNIIGQDNFIINNL